MNESQIFPECFDYFLENRKTIIFVVGYYQVEIKLKIRKEGSNYEKYEENAGDTFDFDLHCRGNHLRHRNNSFK